MPKTRISLFQVCSNANNVVLSADLLYSLVHPPHTGSDVLYQSRADTCMLRYNRSTILKLYAITRHVAQPGAVIFSSDDLLLQLNETVENKQRQSQQAVSSLKHPKMFKKVPKVNDGDSVRQSNAIDEAAISDYQRMAVKQQDQLQEEKSIQIPNTLAEDASSSSAGEFTPNNFNSRNNYARPSLNYRSKNRQKQIHEHPQSYQQQATLDDYDNYYDELNRPKNLNDRYEINRGIRSQSSENVVDVEAAVNSATDAPYRDGNAIPVPGYIKNHPDTLWDLEIEKEENEAINGACELVISEFSSIII